MKLVAQFALLLCFEYLSLAQAKLPTLRVLLKNDNNNGCSQDQINILKQVLSVGANAAGTADNLLNQIPTGLSAEVIETYLGGKSTPSQERTFNASRRLHLSNVALTFNGTLKTENQLSPSGPSLTFTCPTGQETPILMGNQSIFQLGSDFFAAVPTGPSPPDLLDADRSAYEAAKSKSGEPTVPTQFPPFGSASFLLLRQIHSVEDVVTGATVGINPRAPANLIGGKSPDADAWATVSILSLLDAGRFNPCNPNVSNKVGPTASLPLCSLTTGQAAIRKRSQQRAVRRRGIGVPVIQRRAPPKLTLAVPEDKKAIPKLTLAVPEGEKAVPKLNLNLVLPPGKKAPKLNIIPAAFEEIPPGPKPSTEQASLKLPDFLKEPSPGYLSSGSRSPGRMTPQIEKARQSAHPLKGPAKPPMPRLANVLDLAKPQEPKFKVSQTVDALDPAEIHKKESLDLDEIYKQPTKKPPQPKKPKAYPPLPPLSNALDLAMPSEPKFKIPKTVDALKPPDFLKEPPPGYLSSGSRGRTTRQKEKAHQHPLKGPAKPPMPRLANALDLAKPQEPKFKVSQTVDALDPAEIHKKESLDLDEIYKQPTKKPPQPKKPKARLPLPPLSNALDLAELYEMPREPLDFSEKPKEWKKLPPPPKKSTLKPPHSLHVLDLLPPPSGKSAKSSSTLEVLDLMPPLLKSKKKVHFEWTGLDRKVPPKEYEKDGKPNFRRRRHIGS